MIRLSFTIGRKLTKGEISSTGIYGLISKDKGICLRVSLIKEIADLHQDESRYGAEIHLFA